MDDFDASALPENVVTVSKPSKILQKFYEKRKAEHDKTLKMIHQEKEKINAEIDATIAVETATNNTKIDKIKSEMDLYFSTLLENIEKTIEINYSDIFEKMDEAKKKLEKTIEQYHSKLKELEKNRSKKLKALLKEYFEKLSKISHVSTIELDRLFEKTILVFNTITLDNYEMYAEEIKNYELDVDSAVKTWTEKISYLTLKLRDMYICLAKKSTVLFTSSFVQDIHRLTATDIQEEIKKIRSFQAALLRSLSTDSLLPVNQDEVAAWLKDMQETLACLDQTAGNVVSHYKSIIILLFNRFFDDLEYLKVSMAKTELFDKDNIEEFQSQIYTPDIEDLNIKVKKDLKKMQEIWQQSIEEMTVSITDTYTFLKTATYVWDRHFTRIKNLQNLILHDLSNTVEKYNRSMNNIESRMNIIIEKVRQSSNARNLENNYKKAIAILDEMVVVFHASETREEQVLQNYKSLIELDIEVLVAELKRFLFHHPPDENRDPKKQRKRASQISELEVDPNETYIPRQMIYCIFHVDAAKNWMFGLWESINQYMNSCRGEILASASQWLQAQDKKAKERLAVKLAFHKPRYNRLKYSIYVVRRNELNRHFDRFANHKKAAEHQIQLLKNRQSDDLKQCMISVESVRNECQKIFKLAQESYISHQVNTFTMKQKVYAESQYKEIEKVGYKCIHSYQDFLEKLRISHYLYLSSIRFFGENGNYCSDELEALIKDLTKLEANTSKQIENLIEKTNVRMMIHRKEIDSFLMDNCQMLYEICEEHKNNEKANKMLRIARDSILKEIVDIQLKLKHLQKNSLHFVCESIEKVGISKYATKFSEEFQHIMDNIQAFFVEIEHPEPIISLSAHGRTLAHTRSMKLAKKKADKQSDKNNLSLQAFLTDKNLNNFITKVVTIIISTITKLEKDGKEFYGKHHEIILDPSKTYLSYNDFIEDKSESCRALLYQTEEFWTDLIKECILTLKELQQFKQRYLSIFTNTVHILKKDNLSALNEWITIELVKEEEKTKKSLKEMYDKLRVLYGHPSNKNILDNLEKEFEDFMNDNFDIKAEETTLPFKNKLEDAVQKMIAEMDQVVSIFNVIKKNNMLTDIVQKLEEQFEEKVRVTGETSKFEIISSTSIKQKDAMSSEVKLDYNNFIPDSSDMKKLIFVSETSLTSDESPKSLPDFQKSIEHIKEEYLRGIEEFTENKLLRNIYNFKEVWANEIQNVLNLYKIKYDKNGAF